MAFILTLGCLFLIYIYNLCQLVGPSLKFEWKRLVSPRFEWTLKFERSPRFEGITFRSPRIECFTYFWGWSSTWCMPHSISPGVYIMLPPGSLRHGGNLFNIVEEIMFLIDTNTYRIFVSIIFQLPWRKLKWILPDNFITKPSDKKAITDTTKSSCNVD